MADYEKLTVVKLREELVNRGLPKTGLKAVLIQRLIDADEQAAQPTSEIEDKQLTSTNPDDAEEESAPADAQPPEQSEATTLPDAEIQETSAPPSDNVSLQKTPSTQPERDENPPAEPKANGIEVRATASHGADEDQEVEADTKLITEEQDSQEALVAPVQGAIQPSVGDEQPVAASTSLAEPVIEDHAPVSAVSRQDSLNTEEALEDTRKRKRRSVTPPPSAESVQKKAKIEDGRPHVKLPEDESMTDAVLPSSTDVPISNATPAQAATAVEDLAMENQPQTQTEEIPGAAENAASSASPNHLPAPTQEDKNEPQAEAEAETTLTKPSTENETPTAVNESVEPPAEASAKTSPSDARFKHLLPVSSRRESSPKRRATKAEAEDRVVSPALHPATTALYIRDILRPLHVENLKEHLISLAAPSKTEPDPAVIEDFFLDSIRTHCFVRFSTTAAASRVRTGLHDRVWPDEKNRKSLWVDFVPEEKLAQWFEVENASSGRGQAAKRWEVVYETEDDGVKAYLQEVGSHGGLKKVPPAVPQAESGQGVRGAPAGPRPRERDQHDVETKPQPDRGRGFQALDDLFKSTTAKPKLYYLPVPQSTADKRLDLLAEGRGGGRNDEMRRYSFEDGIIVDRGPEFGARGRGGFGARGGSYRGYASRGGGFRDDYRSDHRSDYRGDHRGDYRPDYRRERR